MKTTMSLLLLGFTVAVASPAFADKPVPTTKEVCQKTPHMDWDSASGKCIKESGG